MNAPGSPSSASQIRYFGWPGAFRQNLHLMPVGNPAPPRPRMPASRTSSITDSGFIAERALAAAA